MKNKRNHYSVILSAVLVLLLSAMAGKVEAKPWVTAYYCGWMLGDGSNGYMPVADVDFTAMTDVVDFALVPNSDGTLDATSNDITTAGALALTTAAHAAGTKALICVGGWATESGFQGATSPSNLSTFVSNLVAFMKNNNFDGIDIDWEIEASSDDAQYEAFVKALRSALGSSYLLTTTAGDPAAMAAVQNDLDQINIMTYDMSGPWQAWVSWYNSSVYSYGTASTNGSEASANVNSQVASYESAGVSAAKLGIGSEFGGTVWNGGVMTNGAGVTGPNQAWTTAPTVQEDVPLYASDGSGIMQKYYNAKNYHWDSQAQTGYLSVTSTSNSSDYFISFEDTTGVNAKFNYISTKGLGGLIIYSLGMGYPGNGTYPLLAQVKRDMGGGSTAVIPPADTIAPAISITSPANGATVSGIVSVSANATDNVGVTGVSFKVDGSLLGSVLSLAPFTTSLVTTTLTNGSHTITATATDAAGNSSTASVTVNVSNAVASKDTTPPTVSITSPSNGATISGTVALSANASDNVGVTGVQFQIDGTNFGGPVSSSPYTTTLSTTGLSNGTHTLSAVASDAAGNTATSSVTVDISNSVASGASGTSGTWIYQSRLASTWSDGSWNVTDNFANAQPAYSGCTASIGIVQNPSGGFRLLSGGWNALVNVDPTQYSDVIFEIYSASSVDLSVFLMGGSSGTTFPTVNYGTLPANQWTGITIPMSELDPASQVFTMLVIQDASGNPVTYYIDNLQLTSLPAPVLVSPADGNSSIADPVALVWNASTGASSYRAQVSSDSSFASTLVDTSGVTGDSIFVSNLRTGSKYFWRVNASGGNMTSSWSTVWSFTVPATSTSPGIDIYQDALQSPWADASWNATLNFSNSSPVFSGSNSISVTQGAWGSASFHYGSWNSGKTLDPEQYGSLQFEVYSASKTSFNVLLEDDLGSSFPQVDYGSISQKKWTTVSIPIDSLDPNGQNFSRIDILETSGNQVVYYLDSIQLIGIASGTKRALAGVKNTTSRVPSAFALDQNYPNPFNPTTEISFSLPKDSFVTLKVYNSLGEAVSTLVRNYMSAGTHSIVWNGARYASGVYFYRLTSGDKAIVRKMILVK